MIINNPRTDKYQGGGTSVSSAERRHELNKEFVICASLRKQFRVHSLTVVSASLVSTAHTEMKYSSTVFKQNIYSHDLKCHTVKYNELKRTRRKL